MAIALKISGTSYTLPQASVRSLVHTVHACQPAKLVAQIYATAIPTTTIPAFAEIELWVDSVRRFAGTLTSSPRLGYDAQGSYIELSAADLLARLRSITYGRQVLKWTGATTPVPAEWGFPEGSGVVQLVYKLSPVWSTTMTLFSGGIELIGTDGDGDPLYAVRGESSSAAELARLSAFLSSAHGINLELGTIAGLPTKNTGDEVTDLDCLSVLQKCAQLRPDATFWIDPSAGTSRLNYITRDHCTEVTLDCASRDRITANECVARDDLQLGYMLWHLKWEAVNADGTSYPGWQNSEFGDPAAAPDRRLIRSFNLGKFGMTSAVKGLPHAWEIPRDAAAAYWAATSVLHYEGSVSVYEPDGVSYDYGLGQVLNFSNWQPAYATARALVRGVSYDLVSRRTSIDFGPPDSLTPQDYLSISASSLGSSSPTTDPTDPTTDPSDPSAPGSGDLPAQVTQGLYNLFSVISTTGTVQAIEGTATIKGFKSWVAETPPRKFLKRTHSGSLVIRTYDTNDGSGNYIRTVETHSGTIAYNPLTDTATGSNHRRSDYTYPGGSTASNEADWGWGAGESHAALMQSQFSAYLSQTPSAAQIVPTTTPHSSGLYYYFALCSIRAVLSSEDDDAAALARLGDTWSALIGVGEKKTFYEQRTTGFSFAVRRCRLHGYTWTCSIYGLPVEVSAPLYKYPYGGTRPAEPTATQIWQLDLVQTPYTTTVEHGLTLTKYHGKATLPDWEIPIEQGYVIELGDLTISLL